MRRALVCGMIVCIAVLMTGCASSNAALDECYSTAQFKKMILPAFSWYVMNVAAPAQSRIDVYLQMPYKKLRFQKEDFQYNASYSYTMLVRDENNELVQTKEVDRTVTVRTYEESVSLRSDFYLQTLLLPAGSYKLEVQAHDNLSQLVYRAVQPLNVKNFSGLLRSASTVLFLDTMTYDAKGISLRPVLPDYISAVSGSLGTFQEVYHIQAGDTLTVTTQYFRIGKGNKEKEKFSYRLPPYRVDDARCAEKKRELYFSHDSIFVSPQSGTVQFILSHQLPQVGLTLVKRIVIVHSPSGSDTTTSSFSLFRRDPSYKFIPSPDEILSALRYITREEEYDSLAAASDEERMKKISEFWNDHGGSQRQFDFEKRVQEANQFFTTCTDGSRTPMGIVYIICGVPDYVDCRSPLTEQWYYTLGEQTFAVQFRRSTEDTQSPYFEVVPFSVNDTFWQYCIDQWRRKK
jgi:GWxTD domain-containing protein